MPDFSKNTRYWELAEEDRHVILGDLLRAVDNEADLYIELRLAPRDNEGSMAFEYDFPHRAVANNGKPAWDASREEDREALLAAAALFDIPSTLRRATWEWQGEEELDGDLWWEAHIADLILKDAAGRPFPVNVYGVAGLKD